VADVDLATLDRELARLRAAVSRVSANLLDLEAEPARELLEAIDLDGETAQRWSQSRTTLAGLFTSCAALSSLLDAVASERSSWNLATASRVDRLGTMLLGRSIERSSTPLPIGDRTLLAESNVVDRCTPDELLRIMSIEFDGVKDVVMAAAERWNELPVRLRAGRQRLEGLVHLVAESGIDDPPDAELGSTRSHDSCSSIRSPWSRRWSMSSRGTSTVRFPDCVRSLRCTTTPRARSPPFADASKR
jgi:hypothetical protein